MNIYEKRRAFLDETVAFYAADPKGRRAVAPTGYCKYRTDDGRKCAIGRHISDRRYSPTIERAGAWSGEVLKLLPKRVSALGACFLGDVQALHDAEANWNPRTRALSRVGKFVFNEITTGYCTPTTK